MFTQKTSPENWPVIWPSSCRLKVRFLKKSTASGDLGWATQAVLSHFMFFFLNLLQFFRWKSLNTVILWSSTNVFVQSTFFTAWGRVDTEWIFPFWTNFSFKVCFTLSCHVSHVCVYVSVFPAAASLVVNMVMDIPAAPLVSLRSDQNSCSGNTPAISGEQL